MWQWFFTGWVPFLSRSQWLTVSRYWRECGALTSTRDPLLDSCGKSLYPDFPTPGTLQHVLLLLQQPLFPGEPGSVCSLSCHPSSILEENVSGLVEQHYYRLQVIPAIQPAVSEVLTGMQCTNRYQALAWRRPFFCQNQALDGRGVAYVLYI